MKYDIQFQIEISTNAVEYYTLPVGSYYTTDHEFCKKFLDRGDIVSLMENIKYKLFTSLSKRIVYKVYFRNAVTDEV